MDHKIDSICFWCALEGTEDCPDNDPKVITVQCSEFAVSSRFTGILPSCSKGGNDGNS